MTDVMRKVKDFRADPASIREFSVDASVTIEIGDLVWLDTDDIKPASNTACWTGSLAGTQGKLAEKFAGVAMSRLESTAAGTVRVATRGVFKFPLGTATTWEVGALIGGVRDGSNNYLLDQQVDVVTEPALALGKATKRATVSSSEIEFEIVGRTAAGGGFRAFLTS